MGIEISFGSPCTARSSGATKPSFSDFFNKQVLLTSVERVDTLA